MLLRPLAERLADRVRHHGLLLPLHEQGLGFRRVDRPSAIEDLGRGENPARLRARGEPRREVHGVAHHRVGATVRIADVAGEHVPPVDPCAQGEAGAGSYHVTEGAHHALLVVARAGRRPAREVELHRADVDIGLQPREPVGLAGTPHLGGELVEPREEVPAHDRLVRPRELEERHGHLAMLGFAARDGEVVA